MILRKVRIQNFKSIRDTGWVHLSRSDLITILAGQNESGKTSFLRALRFFEEGAYDSFEDEDRRMDEFPRVDCTFYLSDDELKHLEAYTNKAIANYIKKNGFNILRGDTDEDVLDFRYSEPAELTALVKEHNENRAANANAKPEAEKENSSAEFEPYSYFDKMRPKMVFYSSFIEHNLPGTATKADIASNQAIKDFETIYSIDFAALMDATTTDQKRSSEERRVGKEAAESLNDHWSQVIANEEPEYEYDVSINYQSADPNTSTVNFFIVQGAEKPLKISQKSQGFQWFTGFNLRLRAHEAELNESGLILLIDEPGQGLHEVAQQDVKMVLEELATDAGVQIIYSTHQPILLGKENVDFSRLLLADRTESGSSFKTISALVSSNGSLDSLSPIKSAIGLVSLTDPFSDKTTLIVEGITEYYYLKALYDEKYVVVPATGVDQCPNIFGIMYGWGVPAKVLLDDDSQGTRAANKIKKSYFNNEENDLFKITVFKPQGKKGIEDFLSEKVIRNILTDFDKSYLDKKSKVENVNQVGKYIFAKCFLDKCNADDTFLDSETKANFEMIEDFLNKNWSHSGSE